MSNLPSGRRLTLAQMKPPSERDLTIFKRAVVCRQQHWEIASDYRLHLTRISQIVKRVRRWLAAGGAPTDPQIRDHLARQRLSRATHRMRLERIVEQLTHAMHDITPVPPLVRRRLVGRNEVWREEVEQPECAWNLPAIRLMLRANDALAKLDEQPEPAADSQPASDADLLQVVFDFLCGCRARAEDAGQQPASLDVSAVVAAALAGLLGESAAAAARGAHPALNMSAARAEAGGASSEEPESCDESSDAAAEKFSQR
jgi:hypothetical protein